MMEVYFGDNRYVELNRNSSKPLYYQLKEHLKSAIVNGVYRPNDRLPTEDELCKQFSVSRPVVRQAYNELIKEELIERRKGSGTYVKSQKTQKSFFRDFCSFSFEEGIEDLQAQSKIVKIEQFTDSNICKRLDIEENSSIFHIERIVHEHEIPLSMIESYMPCSYFSNFENYALLTVDKTLIWLVETMYGITIKKAKRNLNVTHLTEEKSAFLHANVDDIAFEIETKYIDNFDRIVILEYTTALTDIIQMSLEIKR
ncbi:MAG: GntR family transcriptional regulator [Erysipelotrichaceae bacterium]|nr:GntR family transcriptional regulator [Erysipelotrichaceae bacterium]